MCDQNFYFFFKSFFYVSAYKCHVPEINLVLDYEKIPFTYIVEGFHGCKFFRCANSLYWNTVWVEMTNSRHNMNLNLILPHYDINFPLPKFLHAIIPFYDFQLVYLACIFSPFLLSVPFLYPLFLLSSLSSVFLCLFLPITRSGSLLCCQI